MPRFGTMTERISETPLNPCSTCFLGLAEIGRWRHNDSKMPTPPYPAHRLYWVDHLRTLVIILVVNMHACVTYSHVGDWYAMSPIEPPLGVKLPFILWQGHLQSFFMGLLFFVSGYFVHASIARRGPKSFMRERWLRLGLPTLLYMLVIHPFIVRGLNPWNATFAPPFDYYVQYVRSGRFIGSSGPLWFAATLLLFSGITAVWRTLRPALASSTTNRGAPTIAQLWIFAHSLGVATFLVRLVQPIGTNVLNLQLCFFVQYVAAFIAGLNAARFGWLLPLATSEQARRAGWLAIVCGPVLLLTITMLGARGVDKLESVFFGGWHWQAFGLALWEQLTGVGLSLGLIALFSQRMNRDSAPLRWLADRSFAVYVLHAPILVGLFMLFRPLPANPIALATLLTLTGLVASYLVADLVRRLPGLRAIL